jgi:filamentous hemagglutinin family protein
MAFGTACRALANPQGMTVQSGSATASSTGSQLNITTSQNTTLNWQSFNIGNGETIIFHQPNAGSVVWNNIGGQSASQIFGSLQANGIVVLINPNGLYFGPDSFVKTAAFVASTAPATLPEPGGGVWQFSGPPPHASIFNYGRINVGTGGSVFLIADNIQNNGTINAPGGSIGLCAGQNVLISERPDGRGLSAQVQLPQGSVDNTGRLIADAGTILASAQIVNQEGLVQANSVQEHNGVIELIASESVNLGANSVIRANGDSGTSSGGSISIKSGGSFSDAPGSLISVTGGGQGGNGGAVEVSAVSMSSIQSTIDGHANNGGTGGRLLLDPTDINIGFSGTDSAGSGTVSAGDPPATLNLNVNSAFIGFSQIDLQATHNITITPGTAWNLANSTGISAPGSQLTLEAGNNITIGNGASIVAGPGWSVSLEAGRDFTTPGSVVSGLGAIAFQGSGSLSSLDGNINLLAGNSITVGSGFVRTTGGGSITADALSGSINTGTSANGFDFLNGGYAVDANLGGISTANGGNVTLTAGQDIISFLPAPGGVQTDAGSGAFGAAPGNVTLTAGHDVIGHYVVMDGAGVINAGHDAGSSVRLLALSVANGGWTVDARQDIMLQEVRNPNGIYNNRGFSTTPTKHEFDYSSTAYTILDAGNSVELLGANLPRNSGEQSIPEIFPPTLDITAGAGGVTLANNVTLFPSPVGQLNITTTGGGSFTGTVPGDLAQLIMSDSGATQYTSTASFGENAHAATPVHVNDPLPVTVNISGDMSNILLGTPKETEINIGGNMINSRFNIQNLHPTDVSVLNVAGDIINRNEFTSVTDPTAPDFSQFANAYPELTATIANLPGKFFYDPATHTLTFQGRMTTTELQALESLQVQQVGADGKPLFDVNGNPLLTTVSVLNPALAQALFTQSQTVPLNPNTGYLVQGPGTLDIMARNLDLGATTGIQSIGPAQNHALAQLGLSGAAINVNLSGNLDMFSTTISSIAGGDVTVNAGGSINVGSSFFSGNDGVARGIFTVDKADVTVIATGDINVSGSRIATYDGGNVTVESLQGNVDAGTGGHGSVAVEKVYVDPVTRQVLTFEPTIGGSGILALTFPPSPDPAFPPSVNPPGNILVSTPRGNITANAGGIVQLSFNGVNGNSTVTLEAGSKDAAGNVLYVGNIDASDSGIIGNNVKLDATGNITGLVFAFNNINLNAVQSVNVTALAEGSVNVTAGGTVSGTIIGIGSVNASGSSVDAALLSANITTSGALNSSQVGFNAGTAANNATQNAQNDEATKAVAAVRNNQDDDDEKKKRTTPRLAKTSGRVTVILPNK